jgi:hypothetical protein
MLGGVPMPSARVGSMELFAVPGDNPLKRPIVARFYNGLKGTWWLQVTGDLWSDAKSFYPTKTFIHIQSASRPVVTDKGGGAFIISFEAKEE